MTWAHPGLEAIADLVRRRTGLSFSPSLCERAEQGILRALERSGLEREAYLEDLENNSAAMDDLVRELTVGETYFFREPNHFEFIRREVLPELCRRGPEQPIRAWSAGCASGEEAYSLAILLEMEGLAKRAHLLATDICRAALARARAASYGSWSLRGDQAALARCYLTQRGQQLVLAEKVRRQVRFEYLNLVLDPGLSLAVGAWGMDLILCRNVLIYFDPETVELVAQRLFQALAPGGWLLTASSDPPLQESAPFQVVVRDEGVFYRRGRDEEVFQRNHEGVQSTQYSVLNTQYSEPVPLPSVPDTLDTALQRLRALANQDIAEAERVCAAETARYPLAVELHYLHAVLLIELNRDDGAIQALRRVLYLDRSLALAHFTLGTLLRRGGDQAGACRCYRNARDLCAARPEEEVVPLSDGEPAGRLAQAGEYHLGPLSSEGNR